MSVKKEDKKMKNYILLLPLLYLFHDFEEMIGFGWFFRRNPHLFKKYPRLTAAYRDFTQEGFVLAVFEQLIFFFGGLSLLAYYFPCRPLYGIWFGMLLALTGHFVVHIGICIYVKKIIPSLFTSIICLPIGILIIIKTAALLNFDTLTTTFTVLTIPTMMANMKLGHVSMFSLGKCFYR